MFQHSTNRTTIPASNLPVCQGDVTTNGNAAYTTTESETTPSTLTSDMVAINTESETTSLAIISDSSNESTEPFSVSLWSTFTVTDITSGLSSTHDITKSTLTDGVIESTTNNDGTDAEIPTGTDTSEFKS